MNALALGKALFYSILFILLGVTVIGFWHFVMINPFWGVLWVAGVIFIFGFLFFLLDSYVKDSKEKTK